MIDISHAIDWLSIKLNGIAIGLAVVTGNGVLMGLTGAATVLTIIYNAIRIYKELKHKKQ